ncbi:MAG: Mov34/MPN/PAD-1 family protein [Alloprevotella sp.]|nr:Mov34/MPN/PAD-1 family protein [Alloprevotella sp.]
MSNYCQTVIFSDKAYNAIIDETFRKDPIETGGILLGHVLDNDLWVVMEVIPPGIDSVHQYAYFEYDEKFVNYLAESVATKYENKLELLGLWHRHPGSMDTFSGTDDGTNHIFAGLRSCGAISGLVNVDPNFRLTMRHVSNPLHYEIVDVEVGDDLIPENYFKLRHFPEKGLNPVPYSEKKNDWTTIGSMSEQKSNSINEKTIAIQTKKTDIKYLKSTILILLSGFFLSFFVVVHICQNIVDESASKQSTLFELVYNTTDSKGICIRDAKDAKTYIDKKTNKEIIKQKAKPAVYIKQHTSINVVKYGFLAIDALLISLIFIPLYRKEYVYCGIGSFVLAFLILLLSPIKLSLAFIALIILLDLLFSLISIGVLNLIELVKVYQNMPWYQKQKELFYDEDAAIRKVEPNAERSFEEGKLVYTVITDRHITRQEHTLTYQMIYSTNYIDDSSIRIYFIMPELAEMFTSKNGLKSSHVKSDDNGDMYLEFAREDKRMNGTETIKHLYSWVDSYNRHRAGDMSVKSEKL